MRSARFVVGVLAVLFVAVAVGAPAQAAVDVTVESVKVAPAKASKKAQVMITTTIDQQDYANISLDVTLAGFTARQTFSFRDGQCPKNLIRVSAPATVFQCGWVQKGDDAVVNLALEGTFPASPVRVRILKNALEAPERAGRYAVTVSSWAFSPLKSTVTIK